MDDSSTTTFGQLAATSVANLQEQSTKDSTGSEAAHKRKFLETFRRWEILFKRKDGASVEAEKWLIAEYYDSLKHLSPEGFDRLTSILKEECVFFPTIKECLDRTKPKGPYDWQTNCLRGPQYFMPRTPAPAALAAPRQAITDGITH